MSNLQLSITRHCFIRSWNYKLMLPIFTILAGGAGFSATAATLEGYAFYRERIVLPADAIFEAVLEDISRADVKAEVLGRNKIDPAGVPPFHFIIQYDEKAVIPNHRYAVRANIKLHEQLLFTTDKTYPVLDDSNGPINLLLMSTHVAQQNLGGTVTDITAAAKDQPAEFFGLFNYLADAAMMTLCEDNSKLPVAMEGDYKALESAYLKARQQPGEALLAQVLGFIDMRPSAEESAPAQPTFVVTHFISLSTRSGCESLRGDIPLRNIYWKLVKLGENPLVVNENHQEPHLILAADQPRVSGSGGCNRLMGSFTTNGDELSFSQLAYTKMACPKGMEQEQQFVKALEKVTRYRISGPFLEMLDNSGATLAQFEAVQLR